ERRRRQRAQGAAAVLDGERLDPLRREAGEVVHCQPAAGLLGRPDDPLPEIARVERLGAALDDLLVGPGEVGARDDLAGLRRATLGQVLATRRGVLAERLRALGKLLRGEG